MASPRVFTHSPALPTVYRVFPFVASARPDQPGGALYIPPQGAGRLDNPEIYSVLCVSDAEAGAIAEAFGRFPEWTPAILAGSPGLPGSVRAIARYHLAGNVRVCDLNHPARLLNLDLRPSEVVSRDYTCTRRWARRIYDQHVFAGVRWWSYYDPQWASIGLWDIRQLKIEQVRPLSLNDPALIEASRTIVRRVAGAGRV